MMVIGLGREDEGGKRWRGTDGRGTRYAIMILRVRCAAVGFGLLLGWTGGVFLRRGSIYSCGVLQGRQQKHRTRTKTAGCNKNLKNRTELNHS